MSATEKKNTARPSGAGMVQTAEIKAPDSDAKTSVITDQPAFENGTTAGCVAVQVRALRETQRRAHHGMPFANMRSALVRVGMSHAVEGRKHALRVPYYGTLVPC